ncbi:MAG: NAD(P)H-dependent oxidoreductase subunit E [Chloroflexi bacterium]|nr:NAD(P)H-dependent oxidoreductase subunit E [Chloroflexota bacterium]
MQTSTLVSAEDKRWRLIRATMRRHGFAANALIETLHTVQEAFGYLDEEALRYVAKELRIPLSRVYGVATFYNHFAMKPQGEHHCVVCLGTACYIRGGSRVLEAIEKAAQVKAGETTPDKKLSLLVARCVGLCWLAPVALFDDEVASEATPEEVAQKVGEWVDHVSS